MATRTRAFGYLRVSGKGQIRGHGFERQADVIRRHAKVHNVEVVAWYRDEGVSGTTDLDGREGLTSLLADLKANGVGLVLVEKADRLARDLLVGEILLKQFRDLSVTVVEAEGGSDLTVGDDDPTRVLIRQVLGAVAQFEKSGIVIKLRAARDRKSRDAGRRIEGKKPFGHYPDENATVERILQLYRKPKSKARLGTPSIARILNEEGCRTRSGKPWQPRTVYGVLKRLAILKKD